MVPACSRTPSPPAPPIEASPAKADTKADAPHDATDARIGSHGAVDDWVIQRLRESGHELHARDYDWQGVHAGTSRIVARRAYWVADPAMWLLILRFNAPADAAAAREPLLGAYDRLDLPPYSAGAATSGAYLLIVGFASTKPVSPEMERQRDAYLTAFTRSPDGR